MKEQLIIRLNITALYLTLAALMILWAGFGCSKKADLEKTPTLKPPVAEKIKKELTAHGHTRIDNYYWLQERENPKVMDYLKAENAYTDAVLKHTEVFQEKIYKEIIARLKQSDQSVPYKTNGYYYYRRFETGKEYPVYCRKKGGLDQPEEIMLDLNVMAEGHNYYHVSGRTVSPDNRLLAYGVDTVSRRKYTLQFKNLETGELLPDTIPNTAGEAFWANDNKTVFYAVKDATLRPHKIMRHRLGEPVEKDTLMYHEKDTTFTSFPFKSGSQKYIMIFSNSTQTTEFRYLDADRPDSEFKVFLPRERDHLYTVKHFKDKFYIRTNWDAKNFRLMETPVDKTGKENWKDVIPHREDVLLENFQVFKNHLAVAERKEGLNRIRVAQWKDMSHHYIEFPEPVYMAYLAYHPGDGLDAGDTDPGPDTLRYGYSSLTTPRSTFDYNMTDKTRVLKKQDEVGGGFNAADYQSERRFAEARDGAKVPISIVYRKGLKMDGNNPMLLYAYGSYGASSSPSFRPRRFSLLDRGFVFALAHIRGGQEMGRHWYEDGKLLKKKNTFTDFIDCGQYLIKEKFTNPDKLFAMGGSAGGLLMGAVTNMRPDMFKGVIAQVPWMDVVTCMLDESIPLTTGEFDEWGNPKNKEYYDYMLSYSPYDNLAAKDYPAMLVTTGFHDSQVQYWDPAKYVAKMRALKTDGNPLLFHCNLDAGHGGSSGRFKRYKITAKTYAFMFDLIGIKE